MKNFIIAVAALLGTAATVALAQTTPSTEGDTPAVATPDTQNPAALVEGANSFAEAQAKARIEEAGYTEVSGLKLDDKGVWQATAMKGGKSVSRRPGLSGQRDSAIVRERCSNPKGECT